MNEIVQKNETLLKAANRYDGNGNIDLSLLSEADRAKCREITAKVVDLPSLYAFGADLGQTQIESSTKLLEMNKIDKAGAIGESMKDVIEHIRETEYQDPNSMTGFRGWVARNVPIIGTYIVKKADQMLISNFESAKDVVDTITESIYKQGLDLKQDFNTLTIMEEHTKNYVRQTLLHVIALEQKIQDTRDELARMESDNARCPGTWDDFAIGEKQEFLQEAEQHKYNLFTIAVTDKNVTLNQIALMKQNAWNLYKNAESIKTTVIPGWQNTLTRQLILKRQLAVTDVQKKVRDAANDMLVEGARQTKELQAAIGAESRRGAIDVEKYVEAYNLIVETLTESAKMAAEASKSREENFKKIQEANARNAEAMAKLAEENKRYFSELEGPVVSDALKGIN